MDLSPSPENTLRELEVVIESMLMTMNVSPQAVP